MPRPPTKSELIAAAEGQFDKLQNLISTMSDERKNTLFADEMAMTGKESHWSRDKNLRDVLVHLWEWHQLLVRWIESNRRGETKPFLPEPYNWKTYPAMNVEFWEKHQNTPLPDAERMLRESHKLVIALVDAFSDAELFTKKFFPWTGTTTLGSYCVSATSSHYDWALKKIKQHAKEEH